MTGLKASDANSSELEPPLQICKDNTETDDTALGLEDKNDYKDSREKMKKNITVTRGIALVVGTTIGTGIFITPNSITRSVNAPATSILVWFAGGVIAAIGGLVFCELGTMIPLSGAEVTYIRRIYGPLPAFLAIFLVHFLLAGMGKAIGVLGFSKYFWSLFYDDPQSEVSWWVTSLVCLALLYVIVALVTFKPTLMLQSIEVFTIAKLAGCVIVIISGFVYLMKGHTENISVGFKGTNTDPKDWVDAWNGVIWSYSGWEQICIVTSEVQNPQRNIPIIVGASVSIVTVLYILTVTSFHIVVPVSLMIQDRPVASDFGLAAMGDGGRIILALVAALSALGSVQCTFLTDTRYIHSAAAEGLLPGVLTLVSKRFRTPIVSILYLTVATTVFTLIGDLDDLIGSSSFVMFPFYVMCSVGVFILRKTSPDLKRPYRVPLIFPALFTIFGVFVFVIHFLGEIWLKSLIWVIIVLLGVPIYLVLVKNIFNWDCTGRFMGIVTNASAKILNCE